MFLLLARGAHAVDLLRRRFVLFSVRFRLYPRLQARAGREMIETGVSPREPFTVDLYELWLYYWQRAWREIGEFVRCGQVFERRQAMGNKSVCTYPEHLPKTAPPPGNWLWKCPACGEETTGASMIDLRGILIRMHHNTIEECAQAVEAIRPGAKTLPRYLVVSRIRSLVPNKDKAGG